MRAPISVLFAGGGTGGHVCPAVAVARALERQAPGSRVLFLGTGRPVEKRILGKANLPHVALPSVPSTSIRTLPRALWANAKGLLQAWSQARGFQPDLVLGLGGYASAPGVLAARALGAKVALFEPNAVPGRATSFLGRFAEEVYLHWDEVTPTLKAPGVVTGTPLNENASAAGTLTKAAARTAFGLPGDQPCVFVVGGSQGARGLNRFVLEALPALGAARGAPVSFLHASGPEDQPALEAAYAKAGVAARVLPFVDDMGAAYRAASLAVARSGAATLAELASEGLPAVLVPLPRSALDHQKANARAYELRGGGKLLEESSLAPSVLAQIVALAEDAPLLAEQRARALAQALPRAADSVARRLLDLVGAAATTYEETRGTGSSLEAFRADRREAGLASGATKRAA